MSNEFEPDQEQEQEQNGVLKRSRSRNLSCNCFLHCRRRPSDAVEFKWIQYCIFTLKCFQKQIFHLHFLNGKIRITYPTGKALILILLLRTKPKKTREKCLPLGRIPRWTFGQRICRKTPPSPWPWGSGLRLRIWLELLRTPPYNSPPSFPLPVSYIAVSLSERTFRILYALCMVKDSLFALFHCCWINQNVCEI